MSFLKGPIKYTYLRKILMNDSDLLEIRSECVVQICVVDNNIILISYYCS